MQQAEDHDWFLYSDRPVEIPPSSGRVTLRHGKMQGALVSTVFAQLQFPRWARQDDCDLFWSPRHQLPLWLPAKMPAVVSIHDLVFRSHPETMRRTGWLLERALTPASMHRATRLLASSESVKRALSQYYPQHVTKTEVILLSSSLHEQPATSATDRPWSPPKAPYFVFSGSMEPRKNLDRLLSAFERVRSDAKVQHHLVLISGGGWRQEQTLNTIKRLGDCVHLLQNVSEPAKSEIFRGADFVALPSLHEGFGIPIAEGIKLGKPILTSNVASMPEVAGAAGDYIDPLSVTSITEALTRLCQDPAHREKLALAAQKMADTYTWRECAEQTLDAFKTAAFKPATSQKTQGKAQR